MVIRWSFDHFEINIENNSSIDMKILVHFRQLNIKKNEQSKLKEKKHSKGGSKTVPESVFNATNNAICDYSMSL